MASRFRAPTGRHRHQGTLGQNGFANTDLDFQLKQHRLDRVIVVGMLANTCIEATGRYVMELGYHVTLVKDASAAFTADRMHAAHELNGPNFAHAILTTDELIALLFKARGLIQFIPTEEVHHERNKGSRGLF